MELELDNSWIETYINKLEDVSFFLTEPTNNVTIFNIYIKQNKIIFYHKYKITIENKLIDPLKTLTLVEKYKNIKSEKFKLKEILRFKLNIDNNQIEKFIKNINTIQLEKINIYKDIYFEDTINIFKNLPCLYFIYEIKDNILNNKTAKIVSKSNKTTKKHNKMT